MATRKTKKDKAIPVEAVQELADKAPQAASIGGTEDPKPAQKQVQVKVDFLRTTRAH